MDRSFWLDYRKANNCSQLDARRAAVNSDLVVFQDGTQLSPSVIHWKNLKPLRFRKDEFRRVLSSRRNVSGRNSFAERLVRNGFYGVAVGKTCSARRADWFA